MASEHLRTVLIESGEFKELSDGLSSGVAENINSSNDGDVRGMRKSGDKLRRLYCKVFRTQRRFNIMGKQPNWWKKVFVQSGENLIKELRAKEDQKSTQMTHDQAGTDKKDQPEHTAVEHADIKSTSKKAIVANGKVYTFAPDKRVITVGRNAGCDVELPCDTNESSRLHLVFYLMPEINKIFMVDVGSNKGFTAVYGKPIKQVVSSKKMRQTLILPYDTGTASVFIADKFIMLGDAE